MFKTFVKTMATMANRMEDDDFDLDIGRAGEAHESATRGSRKLFIFTFVEGIEVRAICDGEKRGTLPEESGVYYATASEMVSLVKEKADGLSTGSNTNRDRFRVEILLANVTSVAKMALGRIMREWTRQHPAKRVVRRIRLRGEEARKELRRQRRKRRRTIFKLSDNLPLAQMGPLSPRELAIVQHFQALGAGGDQQNELQRNAGGDMTDSNEEDEHDEDGSSEESDLEAPSDVDEREEDDDAEGNEEPRPARAGVAPPADEEESDDEEKENDDHPPDREGEEKEGDEPGAGARGAGNDEENAANRQQDQPPPPDQRRPPDPSRRLPKRKGRDPEEPVYREEVVMVPFEMTFEALAKEFVECFKHLEELSVKFHDDRLRQFPAFSYQHNPLARLFSIRANLTDLETAHIAMLGSASAGEQHTRNFFPASMVLSLYLKGFPDRFRDMVNSAVTVDPARYMHGWDDVLDRIEEMLGIWGKTSDVVYMGLLAQIQKGGSKPKGNEPRSQGRRQRNEWDRFINSLKEESPGKQDADDEADEAPVTKSELKSIIAAALANPNSQLQQAKDQDKRYNKRDDRGGDYKGRRHQRERGYDNRRHDNGRRHSGGRTGSFDDKLRIAAQWQNKMCKEGTPRDLKLCIHCHEWHFLHVSYGCPREKAREWDPKAQPFNDFPATKEAQSILRVKDEEDLRTYKQKHDGKTPREQRASDWRDRQNQQRPSSHYQRRDF